MSRIESVRAREVFDSRGNPTVEVEICCEGASRAGRAIVPSGASTGKFEAVELRDTDADRLNGTGVCRAVENVNRQIAAALLRRDADDQQAIDTLLCALDGTADKSNLGANALLGASLACAHAAAAAKRVPLVCHLHDVWSRIPAANPLSAGSAPLVIPLPMVNMISGGLHAGGNLDFQDFLVLPVGAASYRQALEWTVGIYRALGQILVADGHEGRLVGDEGGFGPKLRHNEDAVRYVVRAIEGAGLRPGRDVGIGIDVASSRFFSGGRYHLQSRGEGKLDGAGLVDLLEGWVDRYPIISLEDAAAEEDWESWQLLTRRLGGRVQLIGDDLFVTNSDRIAKGVAVGAANCVLIKPNQAGTLWETLAAMRRAIDAGYRTVVSARSGETEDTTIADLAVATAAGQIKIGSVARSERLAKYNRLLRLEERLGDGAVWRGEAVLKG